MRLDLPVLTLLVLSLPLCARAQSLGDVARETREERQQSGVHATRVVTNDDLPKHQALLKRTRRVPKPGPKQSLPQRATRQNRQHPARRPAPPKKAKKPPPRNAPEKTARRSHRRRPRRRLPSRKERIARTNSRSAPTRSTRPSPTAFKSCATTSPQPNCNSPGWRRSRSTIRMSSSVRQQCLPR